VYQEHLASKEHIKYYLTPGKDIPWLWHSSCFDCTAYVFSLMGIKLPNFWLIFARLAMSQWRLGSDFDGGKVLFLSLLITSGCAGSVPLDPETCVVYSFRLLIIKSILNHEVADFSGCEIHVFDPNSPFAADKFAAKYYELGLLDHRAR
jgi:hypothetical protein